MERAARSHFLKALGHARSPLPQDWLGAVDLGRTGFPRRPRLVSGDRLILYAPVWQRVFAAVEVLGEPARTREGRWPWTVEVEPLVLVPLLANAPPVQVAGIAPRSMSQHSHIRIDSEQYRRASEALASVAL